VLPGGCAWCQPRWLGRAFYAVPVETLTFLFTDIEGSTALLRRLGEGIYAQVLADHHSLIRSDRSVGGKCARWVFADGLLFARRELSAGTHRSCCR